MGLTGAASNSDMMICGVFRTRAPAAPQVRFAQTSAAEQVASFEVLQADELLQSDEGSLERSESLFARSLITQQDREAAELQVKEDQAAVDEATVSSTSRGCAPANPWCSQSRPIPAGNSTAP